MPPTRTALGPLLGTALLLACSGSHPVGSCRSRSDCGSNEACVDLRCVPDAREDAGRADAGGALDAGAVDAGAVDAGAHDAGAADASPDAAPTCTRACGEIDVDGNGRVEDSDFAELPEAVVTDACLRAAADVNRDGAYDAEDTHALLAVVAGAARAVCEPCGGCADLDGDSDVDVADAELAARLRAGTPTTCELLSADVLREGRLGERAAWLVAAIADGRVEPTCGACADTWTCGDLNQDGTVSVLDVIRAIGAATSTDAVTPCAFAAGDVIGDGVIDRRDGFAITAIVLGTLLGSGDVACEPCPPRRCGDVNADGAVGSGDTIVIRSIELGTREANLCERAHADINADGRVNARDANLARDIFLGRAAPEERCPICTAICGDVTQDGMLTRADLARLGEAGSSVLTICERDSADLDGDGTVGPRDERLLEAAIMGRQSTPHPCPVCTGVCGDVDQNGMVTAADRSAITALLSEGRLPTACQLSEGDVDFDGDVDEVDRDLITQIIAGTPPASPCGRP
ncbi:MAG: hypothetical protein KF729_09905 [Sandaracinaceae bacterium]|nr:hypothetical protein [Sandaracinaceae bacterium]